MGREFRSVSDGRTKVLYVSGFGRSGSTLLGNVLGQVDGFVSVGEIRAIWEHGLIQNKVCGCGALFNECGMWLPVLDEAFGGMGRVDPWKMIRLRESWARTKHIPLMLASPARWLLKRRLAEYVDGLGKLYQAVQTTTGSRVIVDTSKFPSYGYLLQNTPGVDLYVLHLVRDPRAVAHSWGARKKLRLDRSGGPGSVMTPHSLLESSLVWDEWNFAMERIRKSRPERYMLLRYEDFVSHPRTSVGRIMRFIEETGAESIFETESRVFLNETHSFSGNPDRFQTGTITVKADEEWKRSMSTARQTAVAALTWPGLVRYGYPLRPRRGDGA